MNWKRGLLNFVLLSLLASVAAAAIAMDANLMELLEMSDQIDKSEKQDFQAALDRANACIRARNFACAESELAKAKKVANSGQDKKMLLASQGGLASEKQQLANEKIREEKARLAQLEEEEEDRRREKRERREQEQEEREQARAERAAEERESSRQAWMGIAQQVTQKFDEVGALNRSAHLQTMAAIEDSKRAAAQQEAERRRARAEQDGRDEDRRRDAARKRADTQRLAQVQERDDTNARIKREADATRVQQEREQKQKRIEDERSNQEARDSMARKRAAEKAEIEKQEHAEHEKQERAKQEYLRAVAAGVKLVATKCPDGEGHYYATGTMPNVKPEVVSCIDVHYQAVCPGSSIAIDGIAKNFIGMSGCFGDTYQISPKPLCAVKEVKIRVVEVQHGCGSRK